MHEPNKLLGELGLTEAEIHVYLAMISGVQRVADIMKRTKLKRPTVYYAIQRLIERGLIHRTGKGGAERLGIDPKALLVAASEHKERAEQMEDRVGTWIVELQAQDKIGTHEKPMVSFYEGTRAVQRVIMETLYGHSRLIDVIAPTKNFFHEIGPEFVESYVSERIERGIITRSLWEERVLSNIFQKFYREKAAVRILPAAMKGMFETTMFLYDDKTLYISSKKNAYALVVTSAEHHRFMKALFEGLWGASKAHPK